MSFCGAKDHMGDFYLYSASNYYDEKALRGHKTLGFNKSANAGGTTLTPLQFDPHIMLPSSDNAAT